jgi:hypothetical protein
MAEILVLGISHYPPLTGHDDRMATILRRMLQNRSAAAPAHTGGLAGGNAGGVER